MSYIDFFLFPCSGSNSDTRHGFWNRVLTWEVHGPFGINKQTTKSEQPGNQASSLATRQLNSRGRDSFRQGSLDLEHQGCMIWLGDGITFLWRRDLRAVPVGVEILQLGDRGCTRGTKAGTAESKGFTKQDAPVSDHRNLLEQAYTTLTTFEIVQ